MLIVALEFANETGQEDVMVVADQAIYCKILQLQWNHSEDFRHVVPGMSAFHTACCFLAALSRRFGDAGLKGIKVETEVLGQCTASVVLDTTGHCVPTSGV